MLATGPLSAWYGSKPVIVAGGVGLAIFLPLLTIAASPLALGALLLVLARASARLMSP